MTIEDLEKYIHTFYGYGNWEKLNKSNDSIWFIGIEERGGESFKNLERRVDSWTKFGTNLIDNQEHHINIGIPKLFTNGDYQPTWSALIKLRLGYEGKEISPKIVKDIQKNNWGHSDSDNLIIELFPLPSPNAEMWNYSKEDFKPCDKLDYLKSREAYEKHVVPFRIEHIKKKIFSKKPKVVVMYSTSKKIKNHWNDIIGENPDKNFITKIQSYPYSIQVTIKNGVLFIQVPHPNGVRGKGKGYVTNFWKKVGECIKANL